MNNSVLKTVVLAIMLLISLVSFSQEVDTLKFDNNSFAMFCREEFEKLANPDTCITDLSGNYIFLNYKGQEYFGISKKELYRVLKTTKIKPTRSVILYNPEENKVWGYRNIFCIVEETTL